jgi:uncharacterized RDD family membrane protein YckC
MPPPGGPGYPPVPYPAGNYGPPPAPPGKWVYLPYSGWAEVASVGRRFVALLLDGVFISVVLAAIFVPGFLLATAPYESSVDRGLNPAAFLLFVGAIFAGVILVFLYEWLMISYLGQTLGKMIMRVKVVRTEDGQVPGLGKGLGRYVILLGAGSIPIVGVFGQLVLYISVFFDRTGRNQPWYDKAVSTVVIRTR